MWIWNFYAYPLQFFCFPKTGQLLLTKEARSLAVEFPSVFRRLEELCNSKNEEQQIKDLEIIIKFEDRICEQLKQVIKMTSYSTIQIGGNCYIIMYSFNSEKQNFLSRVLPSLYMGLRFCTRGLVWLFQKDSILLSSWFGVLTMSCL